MSKLASNFKSIIQRIKLASSQRSDSLRHIQPQLVAVSKFKSIDDIIEVYNLGQRHFGENYVNELHSKSNSEEIRKHCPEIKWHFIGNLQSNKINKITSVHNLHLIETINSISLAEKLENALSSRNLTENLKIMLQVNTSNEQQKNGVEPREVPEVYKHILRNCKHLDLIGLMTIGSLDSSLDQSDLNKDFKILVECRNNLEGNTIELSMGMSHDFEKAISMGSSSVRIGTLLFGSR